MLYQAFINRQRFDNFFYALGSMILSPLSFLRELERYKENYGHLSSYENVHFAWIPNIDILVHILIIKVFGMTQFVQYSRWIKRLRSDKRQSLDILVHILIIAVFGMTQFVQYSRWIKRLKSDKRQSLVCTIRIQENGVLDISCNRKLELRCHRKILVCFE